MYFAGFKGQHIMRVINWRWNIFKINLQSKDHQLIGFFEKQMGLFEDFILIIGLNIVSCYVPGENKTVSELFKLTNISKSQIIKRSGMKHYIFCLFKLY